MSLLFFGSLVFFGVIVRLSVSKSYWVASEMKTEFWTPGALSSSYIGVEVARIQVAEVLALGVNIREC